VDDDAPAGVGVALDPLDEPRELRARRGHVGVADREAENH